MSLNWNIRNIRDYKKVCWTEDGKMEGATNALIWSTMAVGLGAITEKNAEEWLWRLEFLKAIGRTEPDLCDLALLKKHIGLKCNVIDETRAAWVNRNIKTLKQDVDYRVSCAIKAAEHPKGWDVAETSTEEENGNHQVAGS